MGNLVFKKMVGYDRNYGYGSQAIYISPVIMFMFVLDFGFCHISPCEYESIKPISP